MWAGILNWEERRAAGEVFLVERVVREAEVAFGSEPEREAGDLAVEARDLPPSIFDQVGGVDLVALEGGFLAADDWAMGNLCGWAA
jgi:hypothetical protein